MPNNTSSKGHNTTSSGKNNVITASDLGINMKNMYGSNSGGPVENKNYLNSIQASELSCHGKFYC